MRDHAETFLDFDAPTSSRLRELALRHLTYGRSGKLQFNICGHSKTDTPRGGAPTDAAHGGATPIVLFVGELLLPMRS